MIEGQGLGLFAPRRTSLDETVTKRLLPLLLVCAWMRWCAAARMAVSTARPKWVPSSLLVLELAQVQDVVAPDKDLAEHAV